MQEKATAEAESLLTSEQQKDCRLGTNAVGVLSASDHLGKPGKVRKTGTRCA